MLKVVFTLMFCGVNLIRCEMFHCHDDPTFDPEDGPLEVLQFTWLGTLQYIHIKKGSPHYFRAPRVALVSREFALCTAVDASAVPEGYALGNVVFGDYERDEEECGITIDDLAAGAECEPAVLLMPIADVIVHPEYRLFGAKNSVALLKLLRSVKSTYVVPACLPPREYVIKPDGTLHNASFVHVDFTSTVPLDYADEDKAVTHLKMLPKELCYLYDEADNSTHFEKHRVACSTECGFHSGAPSVVHEHTGHWSLVAIAQGGPPCPDPLRSERPFPPPRHILLRPYVTWITEALTGEDILAERGDDPFGYLVPRSRPVEPRRGWIGHWWMGGIRCYDRGAAADDLYRMYHEVFLIRPHVEINFEYYLEIESVPNTIIVCVKVGMPRRMGNPQVWLLETQVVHLNVPIKKFNFTYKFQVEAWAVNGTQSTDDLEEFRRKMYGETSVEGDEEPETWGAKGVQSSYRMKGITVVVNQFLDCHDDPSEDPDEGSVRELQYTWLGALQYIHVKNGTPHYFRVPRVVLISRQFVLCTALDAAEIPEGYALGNVAFGDYERDEDECGVTVEELAAGAECEPAVLLMPIADVLLHPEYKHFGVKNTIALLKLLTFVRSNYVLPACLPFMDYVNLKKLSTAKVFHIDFGTDVPRDFVEEEKEVQRLSWLPKELCYLYDLPRGNNTKFAKDRMGCTTGCGFHSGAPSMYHEHTGHWSVVAIAQGGSPCQDPLRSRRPPPPPRHTLLFPYLPWITTAISGRAVGAFAKDDPFGYMMPRSRKEWRGPPHDNPQLHMWVGHWFMGGIRCYDRGEAASDIFRFYHEVFQMKPTTETFISYYLEINGALDTAIICVKIGMPYRLGKVGNIKVWDLDTPTVRVQVPLIRFLHMYRFQVEAWGYNLTLGRIDSDEESSGSLSSCSEGDEECENANVAP